MLIDDLLVLPFAPRGFTLGTTVFPSPQKPAFPNSYSTRNQLNKDVLHVPLNRCLIIHVFIYLFTNLHKQNILF